MWPMPVFDLTTNKWSFIQFSGVTPPLFHVYVVGGLREVRPAINPEIYRLDLENHVCHLVGRQESPAYFHDIVYVPHSNELYCFGGTNRIDPVTRTNELHRFRLHCRPLALMELAWNKLLTLLCSPDLELLSIQRYITTITETPNDTLLFISDRLQCVRARPSARLAAVPRNLHHLPHQIHTAIFRVSAVVLLITYGFHLGLHSVQSVLSHEDMINALEQVISGDKTGLSKLMERLSQGLQITSSYESGGDSRASIRLSVSGATPQTPIPFSVPEIKADTRLPITTAVDKLFYTFLLYLLNIPDRLIRRLPDGLYYLHYVVAMERLLSDPN
ncbi:unnamed protein product [Echinostoma caproni]|uniref:Kelch domain-containing protein 10 n=1 Tax=Echinostoma caproni TaxID=27848 RepID=A0A183ANG8_9TREM|nr:unnamed protein product [Echinostoma caproni]